MLITSIGRRLTCEDNGMEPFLRELYTHWVDFINLNNPTVSGNKVRFKKIIGI